MPACAAIVAAVSGLSPVTMPVRRPIFLRISKRSFIPGFKISESTITPTTLLPSATTRGVAPLAATRSTRGRSVSGTAPPCDSTKEMIASAAPFLISRPSGKSTPLMRVCAENATNRAPGVTSTGPRPFFSKAFTMLLPSGVSSAADAIAASRETSSAL